MIGKKLEKEYKQENHNVTTIKTNTYKNKSLKILLAIDI